MVSEERMGMPPTVSLPPPINWQREDPHWRHFDNSVNAVSFGFVATAILISMFLVMAVFERFIRAPPIYGSSSAAARGNHHREARGDGGGLDWKLSAGPPSPKIPVYAREVSVLMPGENLPTFIAQPLHLAHQSVSNGGFISIYNCYQHEKCMLKPAWPLYDSIQNMDTREAWMGSTIQWTQYQYALRRYSKHGHGRSVDWINPSKDAIPIPIPIPIPTLNQEFPTYTVSISVHRSRTLIMYCNAASACLNLPVPWTLSLGENLGLSWLDSQGFLHLLLIRPAMQH